MGGWVGGGREDHHKLGEHAAEVRREGKTYSDIGLLSLLAHFQRQKLCALPVGCKVRHQDFGCVPS